MTYNIILFLGLQHSNSILYRWHSIKVIIKINYTPSPVHIIILLQIIYFIPSSLYLLIPFTYSAPLPLWKPLICSLFSVSLFLFVIHFRHYMLTSFYDRMESNSVVSGHFLLLSLFLLLLSLILLWKRIVKVLVAQSCLTLCNAMDCSPASSSVHGILQARLVKWVAILFPRRTFPLNNLLILH